MEGAQLEEFVRKLSSLRDSMLAEGDVTIDPSRTDVRINVDEDEQPLVEMSQAIASGRNRERTARLEAIGRALQRAKSDPDLLGLCLRCEEEIPARRLELMPWVEFCTACQEKSEDGRPGRRRSAGDYV